MSKQTSKEQLLKDIATERTRLEKCLSMLNEKDMVQPGVTGQWSVKDILAHLAAWEQLLLEWYQAGLGGYPEAHEPVGMKRKLIDALNQEIYAQNRGRELDAVLVDFHRSYQQVFMIVSAIPEEDLFAPGRYSWTGRFTLADYVAGNTCNHYAWAGTQILKWKNRKNIG
jgi:hypothetical protein